MFSTNHKNSFSPRSKSRCSGVRRPEVFLDNFVFIGHTFFLQKSDMKSILCFDDWDNSIMIIKFSTMNTEKITNFIFLVIQGDI